MSKRSHTNSPSPLSLSINRNCSHIKSFLAEKFKTEPTQSPNHPSPRTQWARSYRVNIARSSSCSKILIFHVPNRRSCKKPDSTVPMIYRCAWAWTALTPEIVKAWVVLEKLVGLQSVQAQSKLTRRLDEVCRTASHPAVIVPV